MFPDREKESNFGTGPPACAHSVNTTRSLERHIFFVSRVVRLLHPQCVGCPPLAGRRISLVPPPFRLLPVRSSCHSTEPNGDNDRRTSLALVAHEMTVARGRRKTTPLRNFVALRVSHSQPIDRWRRRRRRRRPRGARRAANRAPAVYPYNFIIRVRQPAVSSLGRSSVRIASLRGTDAIIAMMHARAKMRMRMYCMY